MNRARQRLHLPDGVNPRRFLRLLCWLAGHSTPFALESFAWCARCGKKLASLRG